MAHWCLWSHRGSALSLAQFSTILKCPLWKEGKETAPSWAHQLCLQIAFCHFWPLQSSPSPRWFLWFQQNIPAADGESAEIAQSAQGFGAVSPEQVWWLCQGWAWQEGGMIPPAAPACTPQPVCSSGAAQHCHFMLPMSHPVGGGLVYAGGELCQYSHINGKCIKPVSYPGLCTYFISASYSALSQPQYFVFLVWKLIKKNWIIMKGFISLS